MSKMRIRRIPYNPAIIVMRKDLTLEEKALYLILAFNWEAEISDEEYDRAIKGLIEKGLAK